jgi:predicted Zn-dependent protease
VKTALACLLGLAWGGASAAAQTPAAADPLGRALRDELARTMARLRLDTLPAPYFVAYRVDEIRTSEARASLGALLRGADTHRRALNVELRVGDYGFDNTNFMEMPSPTRTMLEGSYGSAALPIDDDYAVLRRQLWLATDGAYKRAVEQLSQKRATLANHTRTDSLPDFSKEPPATISDVTPAPPGLFDRPAGEALVRRASALFRDIPDIYTSEVSWSAGVVRTTYVNSEGSSFTRASPWVVLRIRATTQAVDGSPLADVITLYGGAPRDLPTPDQIADSVRALGGRLTGLRRAGIAEPYNGPVLFEGEAAAELFNDIFAPRLVAVRRPVLGSPIMEEFAARLDNPFLDQIGGRVLPSFLSVSDDPGLTTYQGRYLGGFKVDDDGVPTRETKVIDHGILKTLLATRVPVRGVAKSSGNRWGEGPVVTNLVVSADAGAGGGGGGGGGLSSDALKRKLLELAAARGKPFAIVIRRIGNPWLMGMSDPMAFFAMMGAAESGSPTLQATLAARVYPDGHEEPIRSANLSGITPSTFKEIVAVSTAPTVYTSPFHDMSAGFGGFDFEGGGGGGGANFGLFQMLPGLGYAASYVVPSVLFEDVTVRGPSGDVPKPPLSPPPFP